MLRTLDPRMTYYRETYKNSEIWKGQDIADKVLLVYCEQGLGDVIQFSRYFPLVKAKSIILHCDPLLNNLFKECLPGSYGFLDKLNPNLPNHDYHVLSMDLPFILRKEVKAPYLRINGKFELNSGVKIGIAWEGSPGHENNLIRSCPLKYFESLKGTLYCLQKEIHSQEFIEGCDNLSLYSVEINDFLDTAKLINSVDYVVSVDTSILHLAGALGKKTYGLLSYIPDARWRVKEWYPSIKLLNQQIEGDWYNLFDLINSIESINT